MTTVGIRQILLLIAIIVFVLSAFGVTFSSVGILPIGFALFASSFLLS